MACTKGDYESSARDWRARKEKITRKFKLKDSKFNGYCDPSVFNDRLSNMKCYFDWYGLPESIRVLFARR